MIRATCLIILEMCLLRRWNTWFSSNYKTTNQAATWNSWIWTNSWKPNFCFNHYWVLQVTRNRMFQMKTSISCRTIGFWHLLCTCYSMFASLHFNQAALTQFSIAKFTTLKAAALLNQICKDRVFFAFAQVLLSERRIFYFYIREYYSKNTNY